MGDFPGCTFRFGFEREGYVSGFGFLGWPGGGHLLAVDLGGWIFSLRGFWFGGGVPRLLLSFHSSTSFHFFLLHLPFLPSHEGVEEEGQAAHPHLTLFLLRVMQIRFRAVHPLLEGRWWDV